MKSYIIAALFFVAIINAVFAQYGAQDPDYTNPALTEYEREQAVIREEMYPQEQQPQTPQNVEQMEGQVQPQYGQAPPSAEYYQREPYEQPVSQPIAQPIEQPVAQPVAQPFEQPIAQPVEQQSVEQPVEQPTEKPIEQPTEKPMENPIEQAANEKTQEQGSSHAGGIALTGVAVALIIGVGYKNYRNESKFKLPELPTIPGLTTPKEAQPQQQGNGNDVVVEMEVLLSETSDAENYSLAKNRAYKCMVSWTPKNSDEIILRRGDLVCVKECFNDGYTLGRNLSTKFDGIFPTCCLCRPEQNIIGIELVKNGKFTAIPKRVTSKTTQERRARRASRGVSFLTSVPGWNKAGFTAVPLN